eukprot:XP_025985222.1 pentatricopeptide repeat-containing protein At4g02750-like [Glycine max]
MYAKCGKIHISRQVFDRMKKRDIVSWNTMIIGYAIHGLYIEAFSLFHELQESGLKLDDVTLVAVLSACSHSGLVVEGKYWFNTMSQDLNILPRMAHYICMVDLLARAGNLEEAYSFIQNMPFQPDVRVWNALLAACRTHKNIEMGEQVSKKIQMLGPEGTGNFVLMSNIYSSVGRWDDAAQIRSIQRHQGYKKSPGCSWIEISGAIHGFIGGDRSHPQSVSINNKLQELLVQMKKLGYHADSGFVLHDVEEEEKEQILLYHSEKIAIAFGILNTSPSNPILVTKNLRLLVRKRKGGIVGLFRITQWQKFFLCHLLPEPAMAKACKSHEEILSGATKHGLKALQKCHLLEEAAHAPAILALSRPIVLYLL